MFTGAAEKVAGPTSTQVSAVSTPVSHMKREDTPSQTSSVSKSAKKKKSKVEKSSHSRKRQPSSENETPGGDTEKPLKKRLRTMLEPDGLDNSLFSDEASIDSANDSCRLVIDQDRSLNASNVTGTSPALLTSQALQTSSNQLSSVKGSDSTTGFSKTDMQRLEAGVGKESDFEEGISNFLALPTESETSEPNFVPLTIKDGKSEPRSRTNSVNSEDGSKVKKRRKSSRHKEEKKLEPKTVEKSESEISESEGKNRHKTTTPAKSKKKTKNLEKTRGSSSSTGKKARKSSSSHRESKSKHKNVARNLIESDGSGSESECTPLKTAVVVCEDVRGKQSSASREQAKSVAEEGKDCKPESDGSRVTVENHESDEKPDISQEEIDNRNLVDKNSSELKTESCEPVIGEYSVKSEELGDNKESIEPVEIKSDDLENLWKDGKKGEVDSKGGKKDGVKDKGSHVHPWDEKALLFREAQIECTKTGASVAEKTEQTVEKLKKSDKPTKQRKERADSLDKSGKKVIESVEVHAPKSDPAASNDTKSDKNVNVNNAKSDSFRESDKKSAADINLLKEMEESRIKALANFEKSSEHTKAKSGSEVDPSKKETTVRPVPVKGQVVIPGFSKSYRIPKRSKGNVKVNEQVTSSSRERVSSKERVDRREAYSLKSSCDKVSSQDRFRGEEPRSKRSNDKVSSKEEASMRETDKRQDVDKKPTGVNTESTPNRCVDLKLIEKNLYLYFIHFALLTDKLKCAII